MKLNYLIPFSIWYGLLSIAFLVIPADILGDSSSNFDYANDLNVSGFNEDEIDSGGFFSGILGITKSIGRFLGMIFFAINISSDTPLWASLFLNAWFTFVTVMLIGFIVSALWDG